VKPKLVTFDCAQTLLEVDWQVGRFALRCAREAGLDLGEDAANRYEQLYYTRHAHYLELNKSRDSAACDAFWQQVTRDWMFAEGFDPAEWQPKVQAISDEIGFSKNSQIFKVFPDVFPCLDRLAESGIKVAIISNWDYSLHRILTALGLKDRFDLVVASLEEGFEKPDPRIFIQTLEKLGVSPRESLHVGDDALDDLKGARDVGMRAVLIDRKLTSPLPPYISSLDQLFGAFEWSA